MTSHGWMIPAFPCRASRLVQSRSRVKLKENLAAILDIQMVLQLGKPLKKVETSWFVCWKYVDDGYF